MQAKEHNPETYQAPEFPDVCVASGWVAKISTKYNHLIVEDGSGRRRRLRRYSRATVPFDRLVVTAPTGYISLSAIRWCRDSGVSVYQIDRDGGVMGVFGDLGADRPALRRAQAMAAGRPLGLQLARRLIREKLKGQARVAANLPDPVHVRVPGVSPPRVKTATDLLAVEAEVASAYWQACERIPVQFASRDLNRIPRHWNIFGRRSSPITGAQRTAASPAGAMLNYLYAILVAEARLGCSAVGLDPGLGVYHVDKQGRESLVYDIIEPMRPRVDAWLFDFLEDRVFSIREFTETRTGAVRVNPPLSDHLAATGPLWATQLAPLIEATASSLLNNEVSKTFIQANRTGTRHHTDEGFIERLPRARRPAPRCRTCGIEVGERNRYCNQCRPQALIEAGKRSAARRQDRGESAASIRKRSAAMRKRRKSNIRWDKQEERPGPNVFRTTILPKLSGIPLKTLVKATGLSQSYCSLIRRGEVVPHPSHWTALDALGKNAPYN